MLINNCTFFPHRDFLRSPASGGRAWNTAIADVASGAEDRAGFQQHAFRSITFSPALLGTTQRAVFEDLLRDALQSGRAAIPVWGRGMKVNLRGDAGDNVLSLRTRTTLATGDYLFLRGAGDQFQVVEISSVLVEEGETSLGLADDLSFDIAAGSLVWPVLFGQIEAQNIGFIAPEIADVEITITELAGSGTLGTSIECPAAEDSDAVALNVCEGKPTLTRDDDVCAGLIELRWTRILYADSYRIYKTKTPGSGYVLVDEVDNLVRTYLVERPALSTADYYIVNSVIGGVESIPSNEIEILPTTLESVMRALQERFRIGNGWIWNADDAEDELDFFINFPNRNNGDDPGHYPADGFYAGETDEQLLGHVQWLAAHFSEFILEYVPGRGYSLSNTFENLAEVTRVTTESLGVPEEITDAAAGLLQLGGCICALKNVIRTGSVFENILDGTLGATNYEELSGEGGACSHIKETIQEEWELCTLIEMGSGSFPFFWNWPCTHGTLEDHNPGDNLSGFTMRHAKLTIDFSNYGQGEAIGYTRLDLPDQGLWAVQQSGYLDTAPLPKLVDGRLHQLFKMSATVGTYTSGFFGIDPETVLEGFPWDQECYQNACKGWVMTAFILQIKKSSKPADGDWHYYP